jgi:hypothetical protein
MEEDAFARQEISFLKTIWVRHKYCNLQGDQEKRHTQNVKWKYTLIESVKTAFKKIGGGSKIAVVVMVAEE